MWQWQQLQLMAGLLFHLDALHVCKKTRIAVSDTEFKCKIKLVIGRIQ